MYVLVYSVQFEIPATLAGINILLVLIRLIWGNFNSLHCTI